jgi:signal peptide peptidase SppA
MKLAYLLEQVFSQPALILPEAHAAIRKLLEERLDEAALFSPEAAQRKGTYCGSSVNLPSMEIIDGIAHIPIGGAVGQKLSGFAKYAGAVDVADVAVDITEAEADNAVKGVLFDIDSPGGMVTGTPELGQAILDMKKPRIAFTNGMMASAAYWIGASTEAVFATPSAQVGSVGVYMPVVDVSGWYGQQGVKVELIKAGKLKGIGYPGTTLSESAREHLQARVNQIYSDFKGHIRARRGDIADDAMQGQTFYASDAATLNLIDGVVKNKAEAVDFLKEVIAMQ